MVISYCFFKDFALSYTGYRQEIWGGKSVSLVPEAKPSISKIYGMWHSEHQQTLDCAKSLVCFQ